MTFYENYLFILNFWRILGCKEEGKTSIWLTTKFILLLLIALCLCILWLFTYFYFTLVLNIFWLVIKFY